MSTVSRSALALFVGVLIFAGLPVLGWGIADFSGFIANPARLGYLLMVVALQVIVIIRFPGIGRSGGDGQKLVRRQKIAVVLLQILTLSMVIAVPAFDRHGIAIMQDADAVRMIGVLVFAIGFLLMNVSEYVLGKQFSIQVTIQKDHQLVTAGPYRFVRHPRYLAILIYNAGVTLVFGSGLGLLLTALLAGVLLWRIQDEEALLHQEFGAQWEAYARQSRRLIPFIY